MKKTVQWREINEKEREERRNRGANVIIKRVKLKNRKKLIELLEKKLGIEKMWKFKNNLIFFVYFPPFDCLFHPIFPFFQHFYYWLLFFIFFSSEFFNLSSFFLSFFSLSSSFVSLAFLSISIIFSFFVKFFSRSRIWFILSSSLSSFLLFFYACVFSSVELVSTCCVFLVLCFAGQCVVSMLVVSHSCFRRWTTFLGSIVFSLFLSLLVVSSPTLFLFFSSSFLLHFLFIASLSSGHIERSFSFLSFLSSSLFSICSRTVAFPGFPFCDITSFLAAYSIFFTFVLSSTVLPSPYCFLPLSLYFLSILLHFDLFTAVFLFYTLSPICARFIHSTLVAPF